eukprot:Partr_v1_DN23281_c0_g1_i1_m35157 putative ChaC, cation transport regulator homolog
MWIFGYGSLIWRADMPYVERRLGRIDGYLRRFWQGSTDHRGVPGAPGRVVTLVPLSQYGSKFIDELFVKGGHTGDGVWGCAYLIAEDNIERVKDYLDYREKNGYEIAHVKVDCTDGSIIEEAIVYIASSDNEEFLGPSPIDKMAKHIMTSRGPSGPNREYLFELHQALKREFPIHAQDAHIDALVAACHQHAQNETSI